MLRTLLQTKRILYAAFKTKRTTKVTREKIMQNINEKNGSLPPPSVFRYKKLKCIFLFFPGYRYEERPSIEV